MAFDVCSEDLKEKVVSPTYSKWKTVFFQILRLYAYVALKYTWLYSRSGKLLYIDLKKFQAHH